MPMLNIPLRVKNLMKKYGTKNPYKLCKLLKIHVRYMDLGNVEGVYKKIVTNKFIIINEALSEFMQLIVLCHELGHAILHDTKEIQSFKDYDLFPCVSNQIEIEANTFAAELLFDDNNEIYEYNIDEKDMKILENLRNLKNNN